MRRRFLCGTALTLLISPLAPYAQTPHMQITVERQAKGSVEVSNPQHVFHGGDLVRFRFRSSFDGYLYVMDQSTSGKYLLLFPAKNAQDTNQVVRDKEYLIPASQGSWFRVDDPPGYEKIYFVISPAPMEKGAPAENLPTHPLPNVPPQPGAPAGLLPRCDDAIFQTRGDCVDVTAGPRAVGKDDTVPAQLPTVAGASSRDITVINKPGSSVVAPASGVDGPLIYEFRLAHK